MEGKGKTAVRAIVSVIATLALVALIVFIVILGERKRETSPSYVNTSESYDELNINSSDMENDSNRGSSSGDRNNSSSYAQKSGYLSGEMELPNCKEYDFNINVGKIEILPTDESYPYISYLGDAKVNVNVRERNGECKVDIDVSNKIIDFSDWDERYSIEIYLPKSIAELDVALSAGKVDVNELTVNDFSIELSAGDSEIRDCKIKKADIQVDAGNAEFYADNSTIEIDADVDVGNATILIPKNTSGFSVKYKTGMGNFSDQTDFSVYSSDWGVISREGIINYGDQTLKIESDVDLGNVSLKTY